MINKKLFFTAFLIFPLLVTSSYAQNVITDIALPTATTPVLVIGAGVGAAAASATAPIWIPIAILTLLAKDEAQAKAYEDYIIKMGSHAKSFQDSNWTSKSPQLDFFFIEYRSRIRAGQTKLPSDSVLSEQQLSLDTIEWATRIQDERKNLNKQNESALTN